MRSKELNIFEKFWLKLKFPKIPSKDNKSITITRGEYNLMKNMMDKEESFLTQIHEQNIRIKELEEKLQDKEKARRRIAGKVGGMTKYINGLKK